MLSASRDLILRRRLDFGPKNTPRSAPRKKYRPILELLEDRTVPTLTLMLDSSGGTSITVVDNDTNDLNTAVGSITFNQSIDDFIVQVTGGITTSTPTIGRLNLSNVAVTGSSGGTLTIKLSDTDFLLGNPLGSAQITSAIGGTTDGTTSYQSYVDTGNTAFAISGPTVTTTGLQGPFGPGAYDDTAVTTFAQSGEFSITAEAEVTLTGASQIQSFGAFTEVTPFAALGDYVWHDLDADGIQDAGEPGIDGATVKLIDPSDGSVIATTTTGDNPHLAGTQKGYYEFVDLAPGDYQVMFVQPSGFTKVSPFQAGGDTAVDSDANPSNGLMSDVVTLAAGDFDDTLDAGFYNLAGLGDFVWHDQDGDGIQDAGEPGIPNATVHLKDASGTIIDTTTTNASGFYSFTGLQPGTYSVQFVQPGGFTEVSPLNAGGDDTVDSDADTTMSLMTATTTLASGDFDDTLDAGFYNLAGLGDFVWEDLDGDGIQDGNEPGVEGVTVTLTGGGPDGVIGTGGDDTTASTTTNASGFYEFTGLNPGEEYKVTFTLPSGFEFTTQNAGGDDTVDSDADTSNGMTQIVTLESGEFNDTLDAGLIADNPDIDIEKFTNGVNADTVAEAPQIAPGATVTWTYKVTNTGNTSFTQAQIEIVDDAGTPGNTSDDFSTTSGDITLIASTDVGSDGILSPGEMWTYEASDVAQDLTTAGASTTFITTGSSALDGPDGNIRTFTSGGISVNASAFSRDSSGTWAEAFLGAYSGGLGVTDSGEGDGSGGLHRVDNVGRLNYVLFEFSETVIVDRAFLDSVVNDSDISVWIGTAADAFNSHNTLSDAFLSGLALNEVNNTGSSSSRWANINSGEVGGNVLVIAASVEDATPEDRFKIRKVEVQESFFGCYENYAVVTVPGATDTDLSHYCNPDVNPGIDIEKFTNGVNADTAGEAPQIAPGATVTWTYEVTNTGNVAYTASQVTIVDDAGTPGNTSDDFSTTSGDITLVAASDVGSDGILSPGETWTFVATGVAEDLTIPGASATFVLTGSSALDGPDGNIRTYTAGGISVNASAFSRDSGGTWDEAFLGAYSGGLGVTDSGEGDGGGGLHRVDNVGRLNYVLFEFSESVIVDQTFLDSVVNDSDISVWIGTVADAFNNHVTLSDSVLTGLEFYEVNNTGSTSSRWANINSGEVSGNVLVIAASVEDATPEDRFKIRKVEVQEIAPGCYENFAVVTTGSGGPTDTDLSHYCNPDGDLGIDIEKFTKGGALDVGGLTPGFWKTHSRFGPAPEAGWPETGFDPLDSYEAIFGVDAAGTPTLLDALNTGGGGVNALLRHSTAALLNAAHPNVEYAYSVAQVIDMVQGAFASSNFEATKNLFAVQNELGADLSTTGGGGIGADADDPLGSDVPEIAPGDFVTWTYLVTNTGDLPLAFNDVVVVDDNGTPGETGDDFTPTFVSASDVGGDLILSPGETWKYTATQIAVVLQVIVDFEGFAAGTIVNEQYQDVGLTITTNDTVNHPAMIFDSANPTGGDTDLATPGYGANNDNALDNILIISEDGDESDPDDNAGGGTIIFTFDEAVRVNSIDILDIDSGETGGTVKTFDEGGNVISTHAIADLGDNSLQSIGIGDEGVFRMEVSMVSSGAVTELSFDRIYANVASASVSNVSDSDPSHYRNPPTPVDEVQAFKRFFVVDTYVDKTFEYDADGTPLEHNHLASANYAPRGITMTQDGTIHWVIDKYNGVFVNTDAGDHLGQWDAGGLVKPEGIATDEEDIWIVDRSLDKVLFYDNAASLRSGSQNPDSSFHLASGNGNPRGITTDGQTIWVVNDGRYEDKVFVYDTSGNLQGSWKLSRNVKPRGITINPGDINHIWIVDAYYDKVHEYQGGAFFTSGTHSPDVKWVLTSGNHKPEGIADPPPPVGAVLPETFVVSSDYAVSQTSVVSDGWGYAELNGSSSSYDFAFEGSNLLSATMNWQSPMNSLSGNSLTSAEQTWWSEAPLVDVLGDLSELDGNDVLQYAADDWMDGEYVGSFDGELQNDELVDAVFAGYGGGEITV